MKLCLANIDYRTHSTNEGEQLQAGLGANGWILAGQGYGDNCRDVPKLLERYQPFHVFVQDKRDWDAASQGAYRKDVAFKRIECLRNRENIVKVAPLKDAGSVTEYQREFVESIGASKLVVYYHPTSVCRVSPWAKDYELVRTYHSINLERVPAVDSSQRLRAVVTGALSKVYPLRHLAFKNAHTIGCDTISHPGYGNRGCFTNAYLQLLSRYKVSIATASVYGFALRKIIESVACGCVPVTNLPEYDVLPWIDDGLVRVPDDATAQDLSDAVLMAERLWSVERAVHYAQMAQWYDWRLAGERLSNVIAGASQ